MSKTVLLLAACIAGALAMPAAAAAADVPLAPDPAAKQVTTLAQTTVWVSGSFGAQRLLQQAPDGTVGPVAGAPVAKAYRSVDLGRGADGALVLSYLRCSSLNRCVALRDDLAGKRKGFGTLAPVRCGLTTAPAIWRDRIAYGLACRTAGNRPDDARTGLYVKRTGAAARRLRYPRDAVKFGSTEIARVDLRGTTVAAATEDIFSYVFMQRATATGLKSFLAAASEGDSDEHVVGLALGTRSVLWSLVDAEHVGDPNQAIIRRLASSGSCRLQSESLTNPAGPDEESGYRATGLAADGASLVLVAPGTGLVTHTFAPGPGC